MIAQDLIREPFHLKNLILKVKIDSLPIITIVNKIKILNNKEIILHNKEIISKEIIHNNKEIIPKAIIPKVIINIHQLNNMDLHIK